MTEPLHILSIGAGVQSSALTLMALAGRFDWTPDAGIFADTGAEPPHVYRQLDYLEAQIAGRFPVYRVSAGNIAADIIDAVHGVKRRVGNAPFHVINQEGTPEHAGGITPGGMLWRSCTGDYKLDPIRKKTRELWAAGGRRPVAQHIGISLDEIGRMKDSRVGYITNHYDLVDARLTRHDCLQWLRRNGHPEFESSSCWFCPYKSNDKWAAMKEKDPTTFGLAVRFDAQLREGKLPNVTGDCYVHRSFIPLGMVDLDTKEQQGQARLWDDMTEECEGLCGL